MRSRDVEDEPSQAPDVYWDDPYWEPVQLALGANRGSVIGLVLRGALIQIALGLAIGIPAALAGGRLLASQLYGVKSYDPLILGMAAIILAACALVAGFVPARRAASIDPMVALHTE